MNKHERQSLIKHLLLQADPEIGMSPSEVRKVISAQVAPVAYQMVFRDIIDIGATRIAEGRYTYHPTPEEVERARKIIERAEGGQAE